MAEVFRSAFHSVTYHSLNAKRCLLQMPLVAFRVRNANNGNSELFLMEKIDGVDYKTLGCFLTQCTTKPLKQTMTKEELKQLFKLTENERERELICYSIYKASGSTPTEIRRTLGFDCMKNRASYVELCIKEVQEIYQTIETLAQAQDGALLDCNGATLTKILPVTQSSVSESESEHSNDQSQCPSSDNVPCKPDNSMLLKILPESELNWFEFIDRLDDSITPRMMDEFFIQLPSLGLTQRELELVEHSHCAFVSATDASYEQECH